MSAKHKLENIFDKVLKLPIYLNILGALLLLCLIVYIVLKCVDIYTNHNKAVIVPDVRGLQIEVAEPFFKKNMLKYVLVDSIYSKEAAPGSIVEMIPGADSKVKKNRVIYITVNAKTEKKIAIPDVADISYREAFALLHSRGFSDIEYKYVLGTYKDLTIGVQYGGQMIQSGTKVPVSAKLILVISDGYASNYQDDSDSTNIDVNSKELEGDESWF
ncbi:MAG: PASTA domain-containing protein [Tannerella sp.]|jgi:beta-lactam-binding protein with PASTA domain|nr:PASTA domain-containing protein [Tannerella sp.]